MIILILSLFFFYFLLFLCIITLFVSFMVFCVYSAVFRIFILSVFFLFAFIAYIYSLFTQESILFILICHIYFVFCLWYHRNVMNNKFTVYLICISILNVSAKFFEKNFINFNFSNGKCKDLIFFIDLLFF